jgi:TonB family protein
MPAAWLRCGGNMSVDPSEMVTEDWTRWQGHLINGTYPLGRLLGSSDHSGVFLTRSAQHGLTEAAIKLVPADRATAELLLPRWKRAGSLSHPHLLRLLEWGGCQLEGLPYLYVVMEYADQTLKQLLSHRALNDEEAREMLLPALDALAFLHGRNLLQGGLKPANILVVGDQLKLASDTVCRVGDERFSRDRASDSQQDPQDRGTAADIRALGETLIEALTRRRPAGLQAAAQAAVLPADFSPMFREVVAGCLNVDPQKRPSVAELLAWARPGSPEPGPMHAPPAAAVPPREPAAANIAAPPPPAMAAPADGGRLAPASAELRKPGTLLAFFLGTVVVLAGLWGAGRLIRGHSAPSVSSASVPASGANETAPAGMQPGLPAANPPAAKPVPNGAASALTPLREATPEMSASARNSIHGHIKVWVRVTVSPDGSVSEALADRAGPSRYFERIAVEAARKWTFPPVDGATKRLVQLRFEFSREGATGRAVALR